MAQDFHSPSSGSSRYPIPASVVRVETQIKRSRFITTLGPATTVAAAKAFIDAVRAAHPGANHHCYAYLIGPPRSTAQVAMSDDGEPHATAGRPMLKVLENCGFGDAVAVVTRYFGGTKLGKGGLVRAYAGGVQQAIEQVQPKERVFRQELSVTLPYAAIPHIKRHLIELDAEILAEEFGQQVELRADVPIDRLETFRQALALHGDVELNTEPPPR